METKTNCSFKWRLEHPDEYRTYQSIYQEAYRKTHKTQLDANAAAYRARQRVKKQQRSETW